MQKSFRYLCLAALLAGMPGLLGGPLPAATTALAAPGIVIAPAALTVSQPADVQSQHVLHIQNPGAAPLHWFTTASSWREDFDDLTRLSERGWIMVNLSAPPGETDWFQGHSYEFPAHTGAADAYIAANRLNTTGTGANPGTISNWLLTPEIPLYNGATFSFWTRCKLGSPWQTTFQDRLQVRLSVNGASADVGATATGVGDFTTLLLDINAGYDASYPSTWTQYTVTLKTLAGPTTGRLAFRYFVENVGSLVMYRGDYIGIDTVTYQAPLYDNGGLITSVGNGPDGADVSLLQNTSLGLGTMEEWVYPVPNFSHYRVSDDFTVDAPDGWTVEEVVFYATMAGTSYSLNAVNYQIWDGSPEQPGSAVVFGDTTTNRLLAATWAGAYRYRESSGPDTNRPINLVRAGTQPGGVHLAPGTYWLDWQINSTATDKATYGPFQPPLTILGQTTTGNAQLRVFAGWQNWLDFSLNTPLGAPFRLVGGNGCDHPAEIDWLSVGTQHGDVAPGAATPLTVTLDSTGLPPGAYTARLCLQSNAAQQPVVAVPVTLTVAVVDVALSKTVTPGDVAPGDPITFTLTLTNHGNQTAAQVILTDTLPALTGMAFTSNLSVSDSGQQPRYVWNVQDLPPGQSGSITVTGRLPIPTTHGTHTNTATLAAAGDANPDNNTAVVTYTVPNLPPAFTSPMESVALKDTPYTFLVTATDDNGDALTIATTTPRPAWLALTDHGDGTATLSGTPASVLTHTFTLRATDSGGLFVQQDFTLVVTDRDIKN